MSERKSFGWPDWGWRNWVLVTAVVLMNASCTSSPPFICRKELSIVAGNNQRAVAGSRLDVPLEVLAEATPGGMFCGPVVLNTTIVWSIEPGGGSIEPIAGDQAWRQRAVWTLRPTPGLQIVRATWTNSGESTAPTVLFSATADPP